MAARSIWRGAVTFGIVTIPVRLYAATSDRDIHFHQLHKTDHGRVKYRKVCERDGKELQPEDIVRAVEVGKGEYVELTQEDLAKLPLPSKHTVAIDRFVAPEEIAPELFDKTYWLEPEVAGVHAYGLLREALEARDRYGMAKVAIRDKERLCIIRPETVNNTHLLALDTLLWPDEVRREDAPKVPRSIGSAREREMAVALVEKLEEPFEPEAFTDASREALQEVIDAKLGERKTVREPAAAAPAKPTGDLMAALRASLEQARGGKKPVSASTEQRSANHGRGRKSASKSADAPSKASTRQSSGRAKTKKAA